MSADSELRSIINSVTEYVRDKEDRQALGTHIGALLRRQYPGFDLRAHDFVNLTDMLERAAPELSIVGRSGMDYVWSTDADLGQLEADLDSPGHDEEPVAPLAGPLLLNEFVAQRFKSLADVEVPLRAFNVLVGANGAGKTSVLEGLFMLSQLRHKKPATIFSGPRRLSRIATVGLTGSVQLKLSIDSEREQFIEYEGEPRNDEPDIHRIRIHDGHGIVEHDYTRGSIASTSPRQLPLLRAFGGTTLLRLDARKLARPWASDREQPTLRHDGLGLSSVLANLAATDLPRLNKIFAATSEIIPAFESARMPRQRVGPNDEKIGNGLELQLYGKWLDASLASEGTLLVLGLMTIVHGLSSTRLLLMDDIERALHPKAQRTLVQQLARLTGEDIGLQLVCTTHSPYMLDAVDPEDVLVVRASPETGLSRCRRLVEHEAWDKWRQSMTPGEFWSYVGEDWLESE